MAESLKFVLLGGSAMEIEALVNDLASHFEGASVQCSVVADCPIFRFSGKIEKEGEPSLIFELFGASLQSDFRGLFKLLLNDADGVIGFIPAILGRIEETRQVLPPLFRSIQARREEGSELLFLLQYHWPANESIPTPEILDEILGVNAEAVTRVFSRVGEPNQVNGLYGLFSKYLEEVQRVKSSPK